MREKHQVTKGSYCLANRFYVYKVIPLDPSRGGPLRTGLRGWLSDNIAEDNFRYLGGIIYLKREEDLTTFLLMFE